MKKAAIFLLIALIAVTLSAENRDWISFKENWLLSKGNPKGTAEIEFDDSRWEIINIPHDWAINGPFDIEAPGRTGKLPWKGEGWYPGAGIYRKVRMLITNSVHSQIWGTYITTPFIDDSKAEVRVLHSVINFTSCSKQITLETTVLNNQGNEVASSETIRKIRIQFCYRI